MILGRDFLKSHNVIIDHGNDSITLTKPTRVAAGEHLKANLPDRQCALVNSVIIEPRSERVVACRVSNAEDSKIVLFSPKAGDYGGLCAYSVS